MTPVEVMGSSTDQAPGTGYLFAVSDESAVLLISLALRLPASCPDGYLESFDPTWGAVLQLPAHTTVLSCNGAAPVAWFNARREFCSEEKRRN